jgi:AraC-like DNA-binding protein
MRAYAAEPERAIAAFEALHRLTITVHDRVGALWPALDPKRLRHRQPQCDAVKALGHEDACRAHDGPLIYSRLAATGDGSVHVCHAGFVEWVVPEPQGGGWILFAGLRRPGPGLNATRPERLTRLPPWPARARVLPEVEKPEAELILEALRQLAARLHLCTQQPKDTRRGSPLVARPSAAEPLARRQALIRHFIQERHTRPLRITDLARHLGLSQSRASHAVVECCGRRFLDLVVETRIRTAANLLRHTALAVDHVAIRSGFGDLAHFHRVFRRAIGTTPARYRRGWEWEDGHPPSFT